ncbi:MAG: hypothetical protein QOG03_2586 [Actinomycetota bacterium]|jgi:hypothetical protein|nr:hypothetical protein [Actinomycetota bacterium]
MVTTPGDDLLADLARWTSDQQIDEAAKARTRERWLRQQAEEDARFAGLVLDLAERGDHVVVRGASGRMYRGEIAGVGRDFIVVRTASGSRAALLTFDAVTTIRPEPGLTTPAANSERDASLAATLADVLGGLVADRPRLQVIAGGDALAGELRAVGHDVASLRLDTNPPATVYVRLGPVVEVVLLA